jgi:hypothetical protein
LQKRWATGQGTIAALQQEREKVEQDRRTDAAQIASLQRELSESMAHHEAYTTRSRELAARVVELELAMTTARQELSDERAKSANYVSERIRIVCDLRHVENVLAEERAANHQRLHDLVELQRQLSALMESTASASDSSNNVVAAYHRQGRELSDARDMIEEQARTIDELKKKRKMAEAMALMRYTARDYEDEDDDDALPLPPASPIRLLGPADRLEAAAAAAAAADTGEGARDKGEAAADDEDDEVEDPAPIRRHGRPPRQPNAPRPYKCDTCVVDYTTAAGLAQHIKTRHYVAPAEAPPSKRRRVEAPVCAWVVEAKERDEHVHPSLRTFDVVLASPCSGAIKERVGNKGQRAHVCEKHACQGRRNVGPHDECKLFSSTRRGRVEHGSHQCDVCTRGLAANTSDTTSASKRKRSE